MSDDDLREKLIEVLNRDDCLLIDGLEAFIRAHSAEVWDHGHRTANPVIPDTHTGTSSTHGNNHEPLHRLPQVQHARRRVRGRAVNDIKHGCSVCHELLTPEGTAEHHCGRTPEGTLPASQPHRWLTDAEIDDFLATIHGEDHT